MREGYKMTELGEIPKGWEVRTLGELCTNILDGTHQTPKYVTEGVPFYSVENVTANNFTTCKFITVEEHQELIKRCKPEKGDILMTRIGSLANTKLINWDIDASIYVSLALLKTRSDVNTAYVYQYSKFHDFKNEVLKRSLLTAYPQKINLGEISKIKLRIPKSYEEQQKIAEILSTVDEKIEVIEEQINQTTELKKGLMQQLLTRGIGHSQFKQSPLGKIPESWEIKVVNDFAKVTTGAKDTQNKVEDGTYPFFVRSQTVERINSYSFDGEAVLTAGDGVGVGKVFHYINGKFDFHQRVYNIHSFASSIQGRYFFEYFKKNFILQVKKYNAKGSVDSVRMEMITKMQIPIPPIEEQKQIASILSTVDEKLDVLQTKKEHYQDLKKGLMQQLLTGKIRVHRLIEREVPA